MIAAGTYKARANGEVVLGASKNKGTPFIEVYLQITQGDAKGQRVRWTSYFTDTKTASGKTPAERTIESMQLMGWDGEDIGEFADNALHGLDANEVDIVVELEEYEKDGETKQMPKVQWINKGGGYLNVEAAMKEPEAIAFGDRLRGLVLKMKEKNPVVKHADTSFDFGANDPRPNAPIAQTPPTNGRKSF